jgi:hypothetical protein
MDESVLHMLGEMKGMLQAVLTRMDGFDRDLRDAKSEINTRLNGHDRRINTLEIVKAQTDGTIRGASIISKLIWVIGLAIAGIFAWLITPNIHIVWGG